MDTPRRWQVASIATAVAGLGLGSLLVGRSPSVEVAPIDLDAATIASTTEEPLLDQPVPDPAEIVTPRIREDRVAPADDPASQSLASPAGPAPSRSREGEDEVAERSPARPAASKVSPVTPDSVDSADSVDSVSD